MLCRTKCQQPPAAAHRGAHYAAEGLADRRHSPSSSIIISSSQLPPASLTLLIIIIYSAPTPNASITAIGHALRERNGGAAYEQLGDG